MNRIKLIATVVLAATGLPTVAAQAAPTPYGRDIQSRPRVVTVIPAKSAPVMTTNPYGRG